MSVGKIVPIHELVTNRTALAEWQRKGREEALNKGGIHERQVAGIFRRTKPCETTFNDWVSSSYRKENAELIDAAMGKETA